MIQRDSKQIWNEALGCLLCITVPTGLAVAAYFCGLKDAWPVCAVVILGLAYVGALQRVLQCALQVFGLTGTAFWRWRAVQGSASECSCADLCHFAIEFQGNYEAGGRYLRCMHHYSFCLRHAWLRALWWQKLTCNIVRADLVSDNFWFFLEYNVLSYWFIDWIPLLLAGCRWRSGSVYELNWTPVSLYLYIYICIYTHTYIYIYAPSLLELL